MFEIQNDVTHDYPGNYHALNKKWFDIITGFSQVDLTSFFNCPYENIFEEVSRPDFSSLMAPTRSTEELSQITELNVGKAVGGDGTPYRESSGWKGVALYNADGEPNHLIVRGFLTSHSGPEYFSTLRNLQRHQWTPAVKFTPFLKSWVEKNILPYFYLSFMRILVLEPGGIIPPHDDIPDQVRHLNRPGSICAYNNLNSFAISLNEPEGCKFFHDGQFLNYRPGVAKWINTGREHWVVNMSRTPRYHLQWQGMYKRPFREYIAKNISKLERYPNSGNF